MIKKNIMELQDIEMDYKGDKLLDNYANLSPYIRIEYSILSHAEITFPFYYKKERKELGLTPTEKIDVQVYRYLNTKYEDYKDADKLIVRLNCPYNEEEIHLEIFSVYKQEAEGLIPCDDFIDYLNICLYTNNLPSALFYLNQHIWKDYNVQQQNFLSLLPVLNSGIFTYWKGEDKIMVNPIIQWDLMNSLETLLQNKWDVSDDMNQEASSAYDMIIRAVYNIK